MKETMGQHFASLTGIPQRESVLMLVNTSGQTVVIDQKYVNIRVDSTAGIATLDFVGAGNNPERIIFVKSIAGDGNVTLSDVNDGSDLILTAVGDYVLFIDTGFEYIVLASVIT